MGVVFLRQGVLRNPAARGRVVTPGTEVVEVQALACTPLLALELDRLEACRRGVLRNRTAQRVVVVVLLYRAARVGHDSDGAQMISQEEMVSAVRHRHIAPVEQQPGPRAVLQHQVPGVVRRGCRTGCRPCLAELRSICGIAVVDHRAAAERHRLRQAQHIPGDRRDPLAGVGRHPAGGVVGEGVAGVRAVREAEVGAVSRTAGVFDGSHFVAAVGIDQVIDLAICRGARPPVALQFPDVASAVVLRDLLRIVDRCVARIAEGCRLQPSDGVVRQIVSLQVRRLVVLPRQLADVSTPTGRRAVLVLEGLREQRPGDSRQPGADVVGISGLQRSVAAAGFGVEPPGLVVGPVGDGLDRARSNLVRGRQWPVPSVVCLCGGLDQRGPG